MTERNDQTPGSSESPELTWTPCLIAGEVCGESPAIPMPNEGTNNKEEDRNVSHR